MEEQVRRIRVSVEALLQEKTELQQSINVLQQQNAELMKTLETKEAQLNALSAQMKSGAAHEVKTEIELKAIRDQIAQYIKEIDQCIAGLQGN